jgi:hypothetical protein
VIEDEWHGTKTNLADATKLADEAAIGAPLSDRSQLARMYVQFAAGQLDAAFATGRTAMARNPLNADVASSLALRLYFSGSDVEGAEIASRVVRNLDAASRAANLVLAFDAYYHSDGLEALRRLGMIANEGIIARYVRVASLVRLRKRDEARAAFDAAVQFNPKFALHLPNLFNTPHFNADMKASIAYDIAIAKGWSDQKKRANCRKPDC